MNGDNITAKRLTELSSRSAARGIWEYSDFLNLAEQSTLAALKLPAKYFLFGGYDTAERRIACFGDAEEFGYEAAPPIVCVAVEPLSKKFADALTHRDFLGSILALGIVREVIGDIIVDDNCGYIFCDIQISGFIISELKRVRHTDVSCRITEEIPQSATALPEQSEIVVASERMDAIISAVWKFSRSDSLELTVRERVFVNSKLMTSPSHALDSGDIVSVRGFGRFIYEGLSRETKKGKLRVIVRIYGK